MSPVAEMAHYVLPSSAWSEKDGVFVNHAGLAQPLAKATNPPGEARPEGSVFAELLGRRGLFRSIDVRNEIARAIPALANIASLPKLGARLELPMLNGAAT
jgi:predicted molibdopterin-dependent oxidoreductase YjgC